MPWANIFFSEKTICRVILKLAKESPELFDYYPGLKNEPEKIKDLRRYADLNSMTHRRFKENAVKSGFEIRSFQVNPSGRGPIKLIIRFMHRTPLFKKTILGDIFSKSAWATLIMI